MKKKLILKNNPDLFWDYPIDEILDFLELEPTFGEPTIWVNTYSLGKEIILKTKDEYYSIKPEVITYNQTKLPKTRESINLFKDYLILVNTGLKEILVIPANDIESIEIK